MTNANDLAELLDAAVAARDGLVRPDADRAGIAEDLDRALKPFGYEAHPDE